MTIKYNEFGEVMSVNGLTTGQHLGTPMQDAKAELPEHNQAYSEETFTVTRAENTVDDAQPESPGNSGVKIAVFNAGKMDTYEQIPVDETVVLYKISDEVPSADELLGGFVCAMTEVDGGGVVIPLLGQLAEQHIHNGAVGNLDDMPLMLITTPELAAEVPGMSEGIYFYYVANRVTIYAALVWGI